jgi:competence protein ComEA
MFQFTKQERTGILIFLCLCILFLVVPQWVRHYVLIDSSDSEIKYVPFDTLSKSRDESSPHFYDQWDNDQNSPKEKVSPYKTREIFAFDPNTITHDSIMRLGFSPSVAKAWVNGREKGFIFRKVDDLMNIFGMDQVLLQQIASNITFNTTLTPTQNVAPSYPAKVISPIEMNTADSTAWDQLPGIGPGSIFKIFKHKNALGGFIAKNQIVNDGIIHDTVYQKIEPFLDVDPSKIKRININTAEYRDLIKHPYFDAKSINTIHRYIKQHGPFTEVKDLRKIIALPKEIGEKVMPYLSTK